MTTHTEDRSDSSVLKKVATLLRVVGETEGITLAEISRQTGLARSSAHRILQQMIDLEWIDRVGYRYFLGVGVRELGNSAFFQHRVLRTALPFMDSVRDATGLSVHLSVLSGRDSLNLHTAWGRQTMPFLGNPRYPANSSASGKMLLACMVAQGAELATLTDFAPVTRYTVTSPALLEREVRRAIADGSAVARDECSLGVSSVAVPVGPISSATQVMAVSGDSRDVRPHEVLPVLRAAANRSWEAATSAVRRRRQRPRLLA